jgi:hypothetical protein
MNRADGSNKDNLKNSFAEADAYLKNVMQKLNVDQINDIYEYDDENDE